jgi:hypothetical protein
MLKLPCDNFCLPASVNLVFINPDVFLRIYPIQYKYVNSFFYDVITLQQLQPLIDKLEIEKLCSLVPT